MNTHDIHAVATNVLGLIGEDRMNVAQNKLDVMVFDLADTLQKQESMRDPYMLMPVDLDEKFHEQASFVMCEGPAAQLAFLIEHGGDVRAIAGDLITYSDEHLHDHDQADIDDPFIEADAQTIEVRDFVLS